ncbi:urease accessory protein UreF [Paenibacillus sp. TRM 82003]|nr:urease accessory protein UreF [Paenibacillus sp. TRM 82003]
MTALARRLAFTQLLDSALPVGAFSHSFGLETAVQMGVVKTRADVGEYIRTMLAMSWAPMDVSAVKAVYRYGGALGDWDRVWALDERLHCSRPGFETRDGMLKMGRRLLKLARAMHPELSWDGLEQAVRAEACPGTHPTVHGYVAYRLGVPEEEACVGYLYTCATLAVNTALRLMSIGQTEMQTLLAALLPEIEDAWSRVRDVEPDEACACTPAMDVYTMRHEELYSRLFMS